MGHFYKSAWFINTPSCAYILRHSKISLDNCYKRRTGQILCEQGATSDDSNANQKGATYQRETRVPKPVNGSIQFLYVDCPTGHWTHAFLACDRRTDCLRHEQIWTGTGLDKDTVCQLPLAALFTCKNRVEHVPYSLLCDHSQDCLDSSDEDFCVHRSCSGTWQLECANRQVKRAERTDMAIIAVTD